MSSKLILLLPILAIIAVSGCTGSNPTGGTGPGVVITDWKPDLANIFSGEDVNFLLRVENQGRARARNVVAEMTNIDPSEWGSFFQQQIQMGNLIPYDPVTNTPGEVKTIQFTNLKAPELSKGTNFLYQPTVRVSYDYTTTAQKPITIVDRDELVRIQQQGRTLPSSTTTYTSGPLVVEITMGNFVRTSSQFGQEFNIFPVHIKIINAQWEAGGSVTSKSFGGVGSGFGGFDDATYPVNVKVTPPSGTSFVFSGFGNQDCSQFQVTVDLFQGKQGEITCELEVTTPPTARSESLMQVELDYRYFIDKVAQINVQGIKEAGGGFGF